MTEQGPVISVRGEAYLEAEPELAVIAVTTQARDRDRRTVLDLLAARNKDVLGLLRGYGGAIEKVESGPASAHPDFKDKGRGERVTRYVGQTRVQVTVVDFAVLGELVSKLADQELVSVDGPWWSLRPNSPVHRQARIAAAKEATVRAGEYAEAFGGRLGELIEAADSGLLTDQAPHRVVHGFAAASRSRGAPSDEVAFLDLEPVRQQVTAQVEARFSLIRPAAPE